MVLSPNLIVKFLCGYKKNNEKRQQKKFNQYLRENAVEAVKPYLAPQNMFNWALLECQKCGVGHLIKENR